MRRVPARRSAGEGLTGSGGSGMMDTSSQDMTGESFMLLSAIGTICYNALRPHRATALSLSCEDRTGPSGGAFCVCGGDRA